MAVSGNSLPYRPQNLIPMPEGVSFEAASTSRPFTVGLNAFRKLEDRCWRKCLILGQGPIGVGVGSPDPAVLSAQAEFFRRMS